VSRANRDQIVQLLREELIGPSPQGKPLKIDGPIVFATREEFYGPWRQENGEEILMRDPPVVRYGAGVLHPPKAKQDAEEEEQDGDGDGDEQDPDTDAVNPTFVKGVEVIVDRADREDEPDPPDFEVPANHALKPSSVGVSFLADLQEEAELILTVTGGRYQAKTVSVAGDDRDFTWYLRQPVHLKETIDARVLHSTPLTTRILSSPPLNLSVEAFVRPYKNHHLITVTLVNRTERGEATTAGTSENEISLFQVGLEVTVRTANQDALILPYPSAPLSKLDEDQRSLALLYRGAQTYAIGHGCAAGWWGAPGQQRATSVRVEPFPTSETYSITPDIHREDGTELKVPMALLAGLVEGHDGLDLLQEVIERYEKWIQQRAQDIPHLPPEHRATAERHMTACKEAADRMHGGLSYLRNDPRARRAFQLTNYAMSLQRHQISRDGREVSLPNGELRFQFKPVYEPFERTKRNLTGSWRAFQIAFLLMSLSSAADGTASDRETVDLIWFPTGGGKTEAYLGLSAFSLFMRRLKNPSDAGVHVLMRYTLRLLTAQQFQRASALICAMEHLRAHNPELGPEPFSIGIWLGSSTTPNYRKNAIKALKALNSPKKAENPFVLDRCPWCAAPLGEYQGKLPRGVPKVMGCRLENDTVTFHCPDRDCEFHRKLPIYVIDEDIYDHKPSLVIGTVDKFALLAWQPKARALFGLGENGSRICSPPGLIVQDELHLISGPLGSMVGLYEALIEELCTDTRGEKPVRPKLVCSTATIRSYQEQVKVLYGREHTALFPPPGLEDGDSFFARIAMDEQGERLPGRLYVGVYTPGLRTLETTQQRTFTSLLQAPMYLPPDERDPYWTLMLFFGSLRELGTSLYLFQSSIPDYFKALRNRNGLSFAEMRTLFRIEELTGRLNNDEVPKALKKLEARCTPTTMWEPGKPPVKSPPVDVCLASSIIEVGVDVDRLSLMAVVRQPKTTAQYIQVTGRVGRRWWERPGLVVTLFNPKSPRDRSHFEQFRSYHEKLYAFVEPTSVTPFSPRVLDRALHAVMAGYVMQTGGPEHAESPHPYPDKLIKHLQSVLLPRVARVDPNELTYFQEVFERRSAEWRKRQRSQWYTPPNDEEVPLMVRAGEFIKPERKNLSWQTPTSMRSVDAECQAQITQLYISEEETAHG
jgi:hypothetical protein